MISSFLKSINEDCKELHLSDISTDFINADMYKNQHPSIQKIQEEFLAPADKWVIIVPEYNGTFPGFFKLFIDACSVKNFRETFKGKKIFLIGYGSGRGGNLRGLDQLTTSMSYLGCSIFHNRLPISLIETRVENNSIKDDELKKTLTSIYEEFIAF